MPATNLLLNRTAIITGGTTGIGRAITLAFLAQGCNVAVNHLNLPSDTDHLTSLLSEASSLPGKIAHLPGDVRDPTTGPALVQFALETFHTSRLDICVSNAGVCTFTPFLDITRDLFDKTVRTNLDGAFYLVQAAARQMATQEPKGGSIIGISSISALVGGAEQAHYTPTKAGVLSLMQSAACALGKYNIRANAILPGTVRTQLNEGDLREGGDKLRYMEGRIPLGRVGEPGDVAGPAVFLACEELSGYVTGAQVLVDGGLFVNLQ